MANEQNLIPASKRSKSEARENSKKGGVESGKSRRRKKALRTALKEAISLTLKELHPDLRDGIMKSAKLSDAERTVGDAVLGSLIRSACAGNAQMMKVLFDTIGESADIRIRERELRLKEKALNTGQMDTALNVTITTKGERDIEYSEGG